MVPRFLVRKGWSVFWMSSFPRCFYLQEYLCSRSWHVSKGGRLWSQIIYFGRGTLYGRSSGGPLCWAATCSEQSVVKVPKFSALLKFFIFTPLNTLNPLPPVLNGHLKRNHPKCTKNNFPSQIYPIFISLN